MICMLGYRGVIYSPYFSVGDPCLTAEGIRTHVITSVAMIVNAKTSSDMTHTVKCHRLLAAVGSVLLCLCRY